MALQEIGLEAKIDGLSAFEAAARRINASQDQIGRQFDQVAERSASMASRVIGAIGRIAEVAAGFVSANVFMRLADGVTSWAGSLISANADMQKFETMLTTVYRTAAGSEEKARAMAKETLQWAKAFANTTPFETPEVIEATVRLKSYGIEAKDVLSTIGDLAAGMGKPLMQAVEAIADAQTGELERLKEFGITKQMLIDKSLAMGKGELVNAQGQITDMAKLNEVLFATIQERFSGGMERMSKGWEGIISNLSAIWGELALTIGGPLFDRISGALQGLLDLLTANQPAIAFVGQALGEWLGKGFDLVAAAVQAALPPLQSAFDWVGKFVGYFQEGNEFDLMGALFGPDLGPRIDEVTRGLKDLWLIVSTALGDLAALLHGEMSFEDWVLNVQGSLAALGPAVREILSAVGDVLSTGFSMLAGTAQDWVTSTFGEDIGLAVGDALNDIMGVFDAWGKTVSGFLEVLKGKVSFSDWLTSSLSNLGRAYGQYVESLLDLLGKAVPRILAQLGEWAKALWQWVSPVIPPLLAELAKLISQLLDWIGQQIGPLVGKLGEWAGAFVDWISPMIPPFLAKMGELIGQLLDWIGQQIGPLVGKLGEWAGAFVDWIAPMVVKFLAEWPGMLNQFLDWIGSAVGPIAGKLLEWAAAFVGWIVPNIPTIVGTLGGIAVAIGVFIVETAAVLTIKLAQWGAAFIGWVAPQIPGLLVELGKMLVSIGAWILTDGVPALLKTAGDLGKALLDGLLNGLEGLAEAVGAKLKSELQGSINQVKKFLGIASPSRVMAQIGSQMVEGLQAGWSATFGDFEGAWGQALTRIWLDWADDATNQVFTLLRRKQELYARYQIENIQGIVNAIKGGSGTMEDLWKLLDQVYGRLNSIVDPLQTVVDLISRQITSGYDDSLKMVRDQLARVTDEYERQMDQIRLGMDSTRQWRDEQIEGLDDVMDKIRERIALEQSPFLSQKTQAAQEYEALQKEIHTAELEFARRREAAQGNKAALEAIDAEERAYKDQYRFRLDVLRAEQQVAEDQMDTIADRHEAEIKAIEEQKAAIESRYQAEMAAWQELARQKENAYAADRATLEVNLRYLEEQRRVALEMDATIRSLLDTIAEIQAKVAETQLVSSIGQIVNLLTSAGLGVPGAFWDAIRQLPRQAGGLLDATITALLAAYAPKMQAGGLVMQPTLAMVGEREAEAVIPLSRLGNVLANTFRQSLYAMPMPGALVARGVNTYNNQRSYQLTAQYTTVQSESSLVLDLQAMEMLANAHA